MKTFRTHVIKSAVLAATLSLAAPLVMAQNIAIVNGKPVPKARYDAMMTQILKQGQQAKTPDLEGKVKEELVLREIFVQEAEKKGIAATADYKTQMEFARQSILIQGLFADFQAKSKDSEADLRAEYDKIKAQNGDKEYRARHILVEKEEDAKSLIAQLKAGAKFEDLAKKQTPVKSQFGYHIIKLEDSRATQFPPYDEVKAQLQQRNAQAKLAKYRDDLKAKAKTDFKFSAPAAPAAN